MPEKLSPFDFVKEIQSTKQDLMKDTINEKDYNPFVVNRTLSYESDCVLYANEMNRRHGLDKKMQFHYLLNTIRSRKRGYNKWAKHEENESVDALKELLNCSTRKAMEAVRILSEAQIDEIKRFNDKGGRVGKGKSSKA